MSALRMSHRFTYGSRVSHFSGTCRGSGWWGFVLCLVVWLLFVLFPLFASDRDFLTQFLVLDDRQCFTLVRLRDKKFFERTLRWL